MLHLQTCMLSSDPENCMDLTARVAVEWVTGFVSDDDSVYRSFRIGTSSPTSSWLKRAFHNLSWTQRDARSLPNQIAGLASMRFRVLVSAVLATYPRCAALADSQALEAKVIIHWSPTHLMLSAPCGALSCSSSRLLQLQAHLPTRTSTIIYSLSKSAPSLKVCCSPYLNVAPPK